MVLTGASSGIGRATAIAFARRGDVRLVLVARRMDELKVTEQRARDAATGQLQVELAPCDLSDVDALAALISELRARHDRVDVLVNNAGAGSSTAFEAPDGIEDIDRMLNLNLRAPIILMHGLAEPLRAARGSVINVSSVAGLIGTPDAPVYSATKWGLTGFSEAMRGRWSQHGVRVTCVQPGPVPTPGWPHAALASTPVLGRLLASTDEAIARVIVRAANGRGGVAPVRPRAYAPIPLLRALAPWLVRGVLARAARLGIATATAGPTRTTVES